MDSPEFATNYKQSKLKLNLLLKVMGEKYQNCLFVTCEDLETLEKDFHRWYCRAMSLAKLLRHEDGEKSEDHDESYD